MPKITRQKMKYLCVLMFLKIVLFSAVIPSDTLRADYSRMSFNGNKLVIPLSLMLAGGIMEDDHQGSWKNKIAVERNNFMPNFRNHIDDYAQFAPFVALYGLEWAGMKPRTDIRNRTAILIKAQVLNLGLVYILKNSFGTRRPDGTALSFPSGHTANVFAGAALLSAEYGQESPWVSILAYTLASGVGVMRMANNKHYISDVLFGAGLGILSVRTAYWTHQYKWTKTQSTKDPFVGSIY